MQFDSATISKGLIEKVDGFSSSEPSTVAIQLYLSIHFSEEPSTSYNIDKYEYIGTFLHKKIDITVFNISNDIVKMAVLSVLLISYKQPLVGLYELNTNTYYIRRC